MQRIEVNVGTGKQSIVDFAEEEIAVIQEFFGAWKADFSNPDGYGLGAEEYWKQKGFKYDYN